MIRLASVASLVIALILPALAQAEPCIYEDLHGKFTVTIDCAALQNYSGIANDRKRIWLANEEVHLQIMDVPEPFQTVELDRVMENLGRFWTIRKSPKPVGTETVGGLDARVATERSRGTTSKTWVFLIGGRNIYARLAAHGKRKHREEVLETYSKLFIEGFALK